MGSSGDGRFGFSHQASSHQTTNLLQVLSEFVRNHIELSSVRESSRHVCFQLLQCNQILPEQEEHILQVGLKSTRDFAERNAMRVVHVYLQSAELAYPPMTRVSIAGQWNELTQWYRFEFQFQFSSQ